MGEQSPQPPFAALGRAVATRRTELGLKRRDLADRADLSYPYISEIENGFKQPSASALTRIADALEMERSELLGLVEAFEDVVTDSPSPRTESPALAMINESGVALRRRGRPATGSWTPASPADDEARIKEIVRQELDAWATYRLPDLIRRELERLAPGLLTDLDE